MTVLQRLSIRTQLVGIIFSVSLLALVLGLSFAMVDDVRGFKTELADSSLLTATLIAEHCVTPLAFGDVDAAQDTLDKLLAVPFVVECHVCDQKGKVFASFLRSGESSFPPEPVPDGTWSFSGGYLFVHHPIEYRGQEYGTVFLRASTSALSDKIRSHLITMGVLMAGLALLSYFLALSLHSVISRPILDLAEVTQRISRKGDYSLRVERAGGDEIGILYDGFNTMLEQIQVREAAKERAEEALRQSEERYRGMFDGLPVGIYRTTPQGEILDANPAFVDMLGFEDRETLLSINARETYFEPETRARWSAQVESENVVRDFDIQLRRRDGTPIWVRDTARVVRDDDGNVLFFEGSMEDIRLRKEAETARETLISELEAKNRELERFTYTVSHDLKSPLVTIVGFLGFLERAVETGDTSGMKADTERIRGAAEKMQDLLEELLELSRIGRLSRPPEQVSLTELAREAVDMVAGQVAERGAKVEVAPDLPVVFGDRQRLRGVFQNLVDNAVKFMGDQGDPYVEIGVRRHGDEVVFFVRDNGIGIDPRFHSRVFGLFEKLDKTSDGTGAGLAIISRTVEVHGGRIWVESEGEGRGTTMCFTLANRTPAPRDGPSCRQV